VEEALGITLVDVDVAEARRPEETAVGNRAGRDEDRQRGERREERVPNARPLAP